MDSGVVTVTIAWGVISGVLSSALIYVCHEYYVKIIRPQYIKYLYTGIYLDGTWRASNSHVYKEGGTGETKMLLNITRQTGDNIEGVFYAETVRSEDSPHEKHYSNQYKIYGKIRNNWVLLNYEPFSNRRTGLGSFLLRVAEGGIEMHGTVAYSEGEKDLMSLPRVRFKREVQ